MPARFPAIHETGFEIKKFWKEILVAITATTLVAVSVVGGKFSFIPSVTKLKILLNGQTEHCESVGRNRERGTTGGTLPSVLQV